MSRPRRFDWLFRPHVADEDLPLSAEARFAEALSELPPVERSALALSEIGGLNEEEIAERLGTEPAVVRKVLSRARATVRTALAGSSRRGLTALLPLQSWWQTGASTPAVRAAGAVAAAVVGTGVAIGGASADAPQPPLTAPDTPTAHAVAAVERAPRYVRLAPARLVAATAVPATRESVTVTRSPARAESAEPKKRAERRGKAAAAPRRGPAEEARAPVTQAPVAHAPVGQAPPRATPPRERAPTRPGARPAPRKRVETVARTLPSLPVPVSVPVPAPVRVPVPPPNPPPLPVPVPVEPPALPAPPPPPVVPTLP